MNLIVQPPAFRGSITAPPSKSHTMRALLCASLSRKTSVITAPLMSADTFSAIQALRQLGVRIEEIPGKLAALKITPPAAGLLSFPAATLDLGNSGSLLYFLGMILAAGTAPVTLTGDESLQSRPVAPLLTVYRQGGIACSAAQIENDICCMEVPPLRFCGQLPAQTYQLTGPFSQPVTGLLLAAPLLKGNTRIVFTHAGERPYLKMTCDWLKTAGISLSYREKSFNADTCVFEITGQQQYRPFAVTVPGDWSSALFPIAAAVICNAELCITNVDPADSQGDFQAVKILQAMGANIRCDTERRTVSVFPRSRTLQGGRFDCADIPDAVPMLAATALFCSGQTYLTNAGVCRFKECDRLHTTAEELAKFGARIEEGSDFLCIDGIGGVGGTTSIDGIGGIAETASIDRTECMGETSSVGSRRDSGTYQLHPARVHSRNDHRIAMMLAVAASGIARQLPHTHIPCECSIVEDFDCVAISYPQFIGDMNKAGAGFRIAGTY